MLEYVRTTQGETTDVEHFLSYNADSTMVTIRSQIPGITWLSKARLTFNQAGEFISHYGYHGEITELIDSINHLSSTSKEAYKDSGFYAYEVSPDGDVLEISQYRRGYFPYHKKELLHVSGFTYSRHLSPWYHPMQRKHLALFIKLNFDYPLYLSKHLPTIARYTYPEGHESSYHYRYEFGSSNRVVRLERLKPDGSLCGQWGFSYEQD